MKTEQGHSRGVDGKWGIKKKPTDLYCFTKN